MVNKKKFVGNKSEPLDKAVRQKKKVSDPPPVYLHNHLPTHPSPTTPPVDQTFVKLKGKALEEPKKDWWNMGKQVGLGDARMNKK